MDELDRLFSYENEYPEFTDGDEPRADYLTRVLVNFLRRLWFTDRIVDFCWHQFLSKTDSPKGTNKMCHYYMMEAIVKRYVRDRMDGDKNLLGSTFTLNQEEAKYLALNLQHHDNDSNEIPEPAILHTLKPLCVQNTDDQDYFVHVLINRIPAIDQYIDDFLSRLHGIVGYIGNGFVTDENWVQMLRFMELAKINDEPPVFLAMKCWTYLINEYDKYFAECENDNDIVGAEAGCGARVLRDLFSVSLKNEQIADYFPNANK